jgi:hypothetical protein
MRKTAYIIHHNLDGRYYLEYNDHIMPTSFSTKEQAVLKMRALIHQQSFYYDNQGNLISDGEFMSPPQLLQEMSKSIEQVTEEARMGRLPGPTMGWPDNVPIKTEQPKVDPIGIPPETPILSEENYVPVNFSKIVKEDMNVTTDEVIISPGPGYGVEN